MTTELVNRKGGGALSAEQMRASVLARVQARKEEGAVPQARRGNMIFAKFDGNNGTFVAGKEKVDIAADQQFAVNLDAAEHGVVLWEGGKISERRMVPVLDGRPPNIPQDGLRVGTLPKPRQRDGWQDQAVLRMVGIGGELDTVNIELALSSYGGRQAFDELVAIMFAQCETEDGARGFYNPVVIVKADSYYNDSYSKTVWFPVFEIVGWTDGHEIEPLEQVDEDDPLG